MKSRVHTAAKRLLKLYSFRVHSNWWNIPLCLVRGNEEDFISTFGACPHFPCVSLHVTLYIGEMYNVCHIVSSQRIMSICDSSYTVDPQHIWNTLKPGVLVSSVSIKYFHKHWSSKDGVLDLGLRQLNVSPVEIGGTNQLWLDLVHFSDFDEN